MTGNMSIQGKIKKRINHYYGLFDAKRRRDRANGHAHRLKRVPLTREEKKAIKDMWGEWGGKYWSFEFYKAFCGTFNIQFVPDDYYDYAEHVLNLRWAAIFLQHKCIHKYFLPDANRPKPIVQKIDGHYMSVGGVEISEGDAVNILKSKSLFIAKNALGPGGGECVRKIDVNRDGMSELNKVLGWHDIEFEEIIDQHEFMAQFNPNSVNTIRFVTLNINGQCSMLSAFIRMGSVGSYVDNLSGGNGVLVGLNQAGDVNEFGINKVFEKKYNTPMGIPLKGLRVPNYERLKEQIIAFHRQIPFANLIGWDVAIDKNGNPIVIEVNLDSALLEAHQAFNGPIFGDRLFEVMKYIEDRRPTLRHSYITY